VYENKINVGRELRKKLDERNKAKEERIK